METKNLIILLISIAIPVILYFIFKNGRKIKFPRRKSSSISTPVNTTSSPDGSAGSANSSSQSKKASSLWDNIGNIIVTALIVFGVIVVCMFVSQTVTKCQRSPESNSNTNAPIQKRTMYLFANYPNGMIAVNITGTAYFYPKGGKVRITSPSGFTWIDEPGVQSPTPPREDGIYLIQKKEQTALGIEIWN